MDKNKKKKLRDIRNALVMVCVMVAMLSTASYAWFTMASSPTVTGMQMTAASSGGGLQVAQEENGTYADAIDAEAVFEIKELKPVTPIDPSTAGGDGVKIFKVPVYTGGTVTGFADITNDDAIEGYVAKYTYWIQETTQDASTESVDVGIIIGDSEQDTAFGADTGLDSNMPILDGSLVRRAITQPGTDEADINPAYAVRVGLVVKDAGGNMLSEGMYVWEPNQDGTNGGRSLTEGTDYAAVDPAAEVTEDYLNLQSEIAGTIVTGGNGNISNKIFTMTKGSKAMVEMYVWLQGSDEQCANPIQTGSLQAQVQFTIVGESAGNP